MLGPWPLLGPDSKETTFDRIGRGGKGFGVINQQQTCLSYPCADRELLKARSKANEAESEYRAAYEGWVEDDHNPDTEHNLALMLDRLQRVQIKAGLKGEFIF